MLILRISRSFLLTAGNPGLVLVVVVVVSGEFLMGSFGLLNRRMNLYLQPYKAGQNESSELLRSLARPGYQSPQAAVRSAPWRSA
jgi:hypothetical protein